MGGGKGNIKPEDGRQFSSEYQPQEKWTETKALEVGNKLIEWLHEKDAEGQDKGNIFFEEFLYLENNYYSELIAYLSKKFTSFLKLIERAKKIQEIKLYKYGVGDRLNANMTKFVLINEHKKVSDNSKLEHSGEINQTTQSDLSKLSLETLKKVQQELLNNGDKS